MSVAAAESVLVRLRLYGKRLIHADEILQCLASNYEIPWSQTRLLHFFARFISSLNAFARV